jgi:hypothetical protein
MQGRWSLTKTPMLGAILNRWSAKAFHVFFPWGCSAERRQQ